MLTGGSVGAGAVTVNTDLAWPGLAWIDEVLAVMVYDPMAAEGMVIEVLKAPEAAALKRKVVAPAITLPVVEALNPVPLTVTADPASPVAGLREIRLWQALPGRTGPASGPKPDPGQPLPRYFKIRSMAIGPRNRQGGWKSAGQVAPTGTFPILRVGRRNQTGFFRIPLKGTRGYLVGSCRPSLLVTEGSTGATRGSPVEAVTDRGPGRQVSCPQLRQSPRVS